MQSPESHLENQLGSVEVARAATGLFSFITKRAIWVLVVITTVTVLALGQIIDYKTGQSRLSLDPSVNTLLPKNDPDLAFYEKTRQQFGNDEVLIALLRPKQQQSLFSTASGTALIALDNALQNINGVHRTSSLANTGFVTQPDEDTSSVAEFLQLIDSNPAAADIAKRKLSADPVLNGTLVSQDLNATIALIYLEELPENEIVGGNLLANIQQTLNAQSHFDVWLTGSPIIKQATANTLYEELGKILLYILLILTALLLLAFRSIHGIVLPVLSITIATIWTLAVITLLGYSLNMVTSLVPPIVITLGLAYSLHVVSDFYQSFDDSSAYPNRSQRVYALLAHVSLPLLITAVTTVAGLLALLTNPLQAVKEFAWFASLGVAISAFLALTFIPAALSLGKTDKAPRLPRGSQAFTLLANVLASFDIRNRKAILRGGIAILIVALFSTHAIEVGSRYVDNFPKESATRVNYETVNTAIGGANLFHIIIDSHSEDGIIHDDTLPQLEALEAWLKEQPEIGYIGSLVGYIKALHQGFSDGAPSAYTLPADSRQTKQLLVFGGDDQLESLADLEFRRTNIHIRSLTEDSAIMGALIRRIERRLQQLQAPLTGKVTGSSVIATRTVDDIANGQAISILLALLVIYLMLSALFTSWKVGALALLPNVIPIAMYFGALAISGITLNPTTSLIACLVLGIAVDDTVHYLVRFNADSRDSADEQVGTLAALNGVIRPITFTSFTLVFGFLALTSSSLSNQVEFGALAAFTMLTAWITDVIFTPALASRLRIVTLWDVLRLDLGQNPQQSIPLLNGMNLRQARTFALLANLQSRKQGERIIVKGNDARHIYVLVDGELEAWIPDEQGKKISLSTMKRGAVLGEVGYFNAKRTANVDAVTDVRLMRFSEDDMDRLRRRRPFIAALVYRNLNRIQAERLANTTRLVEEQR